MRLRYVLLCAAMLAAGCESGGVAKLDLSRTLITPDLSSNVLNDDGGPPAPTKGEVLDDGKILQILHTANQGEIEQAKLAQTRAVDTRVVAFAKMMVKDHGDADAKGDKIAKERKLVLTASTVSTGLEMDGKRTMDELKSVPATAFDKTYVDTQVKEHRDVLRLLREQILVRASDAKVKALVDGVMNTVQRHYDDALKLQKTGTKLAVPK